MDSTLILNGRLGNPDDEHRREIESVPGFRCIYRPDDRWLEREIESVVAVCGSLGESWLPRAPRLAWVQLQGAGAEGAIRHYRSRPDLILTNASGVHAIPIAEHLLAMIFALARRLPEFFGLQAKATWDRSIGNRTFEITGRRVLVVGYGAIGQVFAERALALGMKVDAIRRSPGRQQHDDLDRSIRLSGIDALSELLPDADFVVNLLPHTEATDTLFDATTLDLMRASAFFLNAGRGKTVDEPALIDALRSGKIAGAGLDVFADEPLEPDSPLWHMERVIVTPHISGLTPEYDRRLVTILVDNMNRFKRGVELTNTIDRNLGY